MKKKMTTVYAQKLPSGNVAITSKDGSKYFCVFPSHFACCPKKLSRFVTINGVSYILKWHPDWEEPAPKTWTGSAWLLFPNNS
jgi:hypothetical protein